MTLQFVIEGLDCANCAAKLERKLGKIRGISAASVNFITGKIRLDCDDAAAEKIAEAAAETAVKFERGISVKRL